MSEYFAHAVHGDDCAALIQASAAVGDRVKRVARTKATLMRMGSVLRAGATLVVPALTAIREDAGDTDPEALDRRLAIGLAQLSHRAADGYFKPVYRDLAPDYYDNDFSVSPSDVRILHDVALYHARKDMKLADGDPKYDPLTFRHLVPLTDEESPEISRHVETAFSGRALKELLALHQLFAPDATSDRKLRTYIMALDPIYIDTARYADLSAQPRQNLVQRYIVEPRFYDPNDPYVSLAVDIQNGAAPDPARLAAA
ncbi:MAG: hypothetical protein ACFB00_08050 [Parvularculaceae bacterium]